MLHIFPLIRNKNESLDSRHYGKEDEQGELGFNCRWDLNV